MTDLKISPLDAAKLLLKNVRSSILSGNKTIEFDKKRPPFSINGHDIAEFSDVTPQNNKVCVGLIEKPNILVVTGSRPIDYFYYNIRLNRKLPKMPEIDKICAGLPTDVLHHGFLLHAARVLEFLDGRKPDFIVGHSLGAASTQILATYLKVPALCIASPQVIKRGFLKNTDMRESSHPQWSILNIAWGQDRVTSILRPFNYRVLGHRTVLTSIWNFGPDHFVDQYRDLILKDQNRDNRKLPEKWREDDALPISDQPV